MKISLWLMLKVQNLLLRCGLVVKRSNFNSREDLRLLRFLEVNKIDTVLDVGANRGEYAAALFRAGFKGKVYSFEALPELHDKLVQRAGAISKKWIVAPRCAISATRGVAQFHITNATSSSSLLKPTQTANELPDIFDVKEIIEVPTETLAACCAQLKIVSQRIFVKLDIQGGEELALEGAESLWPQIIGIASEMPLRTYYTNQASARKIDEWISKRGFSVWDIQQVWRHPETGRLDHIDVTYVKNTTPTSAS